jgi:hypothetical protein
MKGIWLGLALAVAACGQKIETQKPDRMRITRVATAMNHLTVIELGDPVEEVATGSTSFKVEWRGDKVFVQPLEPDAATNLFIWTKSGERLSYELAPAGSIERMHFAIDEQRPAAVVLPAPAPAVPSAKVEPPPIPGEMLYKSVAVRYAGNPDQRPEVVILLRDLLEKDGKVYLRYSIRNDGPTSYTPAAPVLRSLNGARAVQSLHFLRGAQLGDGIASHITSKSAEQVAILHSEVATAIVKPGEEAIGIIAFEPPPSSSPRVFRLTFPPDRKQKVTATLVL